MNRKFHIKTIIATLILSLATLTAPARGDDFTVGKNTFLLNGQPFVVKAAELHYPRIPRPYWEQRIKMCKSLGMNTVCLYVFWNNKRGNSTSRATMTWLLSVVWLRKTACMSSCVQALTCVLNGKWGDFPGGS